MCAILLRVVPKFGTVWQMLDSFDLELLDLVQRDDHQTADRLAEKVPLSPSATDVS